jgi:hypothetical protein
VLIESVCFHLVVETNKYRTCSHSRPYRHNENNEGLGLKTFSFKAQGILCLSIVALVFPYPAVPEVGIGRSASVGGFYPSLPGGLTIPFDTNLYLLLRRSLLTSYGCQGSAGGPILYVLIVVSKISYVQLPVFRPLLFMIQFSLPHTLNSRS